MKSYLCLLVWFRVKIMTARQKNITNYIVIIEGNQAVQEK